MNMREHTHTHTNTHKHAHTHTHQPTHSHRHMHAHAHTSYILDTQVCAQRNFSFLCVCACSFLLISTHFRRQVHLPLVTTNIHTYTCTCNVQRNSIHANVNVYMDQLHILTRTVCIIAHIKSKTPLYITSKTHLIRCACSSRVC